MLFALLIVINSLLMSTKYYLLSIFLLGALSLSGQDDRTPVSITDQTITRAAYSNSEITISGKSELHLTSTSTTDVLNNSVVELTSVDSWLFFDNIRPQTVINSLLNKISVEGQAAKLNTNCRVVVYKHGTVVIPQSSTFQPLTVYTEYNFEGESNSGYKIFDFHRALGEFDNKISSFKLKRGYMVTFATASDGSGYSRVFIAQDEDIEIAELPDLLDDKISFIRVLTWEWVTKKGWCGTGSGGRTDNDKVDGTWFYTWSADNYSTPSSQYVPIKQNGGWPGWDEIRGKTNVSHVLGYNEPDQPDQSNMTVAQVLAGWPEIYKTGLRVGSPAYANPWNGLFEFVDSCDARNYRLDFIAVHCYWGGKSPQNWYNDLKVIYDRCGQRPLWITEWNNGANWTSEWWPSGTAEQQAKQLNDLKAILHVLDTTKIVERYSIYNWVEDKRAILLNGQLTPAGEYYKANKSAIAYDPENEVIPTFRYRSPSMSIAFGTKTLSLKVNDPNFENFVGAVIEKKTDDGDYEIFVDSDDSSLKTFSDTLDIDSYRSVRYRMRSKFANGDFSDYCTASYYSTSGGEFQYGNVLINNNNYNQVFFRTPYDSAPVIILGAPTRANFSTLIVPRVKLISARKRMDLQLTPWLYQTNIRFDKDESLPYFVLPEGTYDFGGLSAQAGKANASGNWTQVTFETPFETQPVVFADPILPLMTYPTSLRVRNVTTTGFEMKLMKDPSITANLPKTNQISYLAVEQGVGAIEGNKLIVGKTDDDFVGSSLKRIYYSDSIPNPVFIAQMQTCNDDPVVAALRYTIVGEKSANLLKERERSTGSMTTVAETVGWLVIGEKDRVSALNDIRPSSVAIYPARDFIRVEVDALQSDFDLWIYDICGKIVKQIRITESTTIDLTDLTSGTYIIKAPDLKAQKFIRL